MIFSILSQNFLLIQYFHIFKKKNNPNKKKWINLRNSNRSSQRRFQSQANRVPNSAFKRRWRPKNQRLELQNRPPRYHWLNHRSLRVHLRPKNRPPLTTAVFYWLRRARLQVGNAQFHGARKLQRLLRNWAGQLFWREFGWEVYLRSRPW